MGAFRTVERGAMTGLSAMLALLNLCIFIVVAAMASHILDGWFEGKARVLRVMARPQVVAMVFFALTASSIGIATSILGFIHAKQWNETSRYGNLAANTITLVLTWLAASFGIRSLRSNLLGGNFRYAMESKAIAALMIIAMATTLLYVLMLGVFRHVGANRGATTAGTTGYTTGATHNNGVLPHHHKTVDGPGNNAAAMA